MPQTKVVARGNFKIAVFTVTAGGGGKNVSQSDDLSQNGRFFGGQMSQKDLN